MTMPKANREELSGPGITGFGAYIPRLRLPRSEIIAAHRWMAPNAKARGAKAFCSWDEDALTMAVEAARTALSNCRHTIDSISLASTTMPNADLQHSAVIATVLDLPSGIRSTDLGFSQRAGTSALIAGFDGHGHGTLLIASESPLAKPASVQELQFGAGAAAFTLGTEDVLVRHVSSLSSTAALVDHFRKAGSDFDYQWEERWIREEGYGKIVIGTINDLLERSCLDINDVQYLVVGAPSASAVATIAKAAGFTGVVVDPLKEECGYTGTADPLLGLVAAMELAKAGDRILVVGFGQGCDALILEATPALESYRYEKRLTEILQEGIQTDSYLRMLSFQGLYEPDWGMRGEKEVRTVLTELYRSVDQIWKFEAGRCNSCSTLQFPQLAYCVSCQAPADQFTPVTLADKKARVLTYTADWLTYHPSPPLYAGLVQVGDEARLLMEIVDVGPDGISEGTPVKMVFRVKDRDKLRGWTRYFWKATPDLRSSEAE